MFFKDSTLRKRHQVTLLYNMSANPYTFGFIWMRLIQGNSYRLHVLAIVSPKRAKGFFQFKLSSMSFEYLCLNTYGRYSYFDSFSAVIVFRYQNLTSVLALKELMMKNDV